MILDAALAAIILDRHEPPASPDTPTSAVAFLDCVAAHESHHNPRAENPRSTSSGLFGFIDGTWAHYARHIPKARRYGHASKAPAAIQWQVALLAVKWHGHGNWNGTHCGWGT